MLKLPEYDIFIWFFVFLGHEMAKIGKKYIQTRRMIYFTKTKCLGVGSWGKFMA